VIVTKEEIHDHVVCIKLWKFGEECFTDAAQNFDSNVRCHRGCGQTDLALLVLSPISMNEKSDGCEVFQETEDSKCPFVKLVLERLLNLVVCGMCLRHHDLRYMRRYVVKAEQLFGFQDIELVGRRLALSALFVGVAGSFAGLVERL
jgi:hypothetical protein